MRLKQLKNDKVQESEIAALKSASRAKEQAARDLEAKATALLMRWRW